MSGPTDELTRGAHRKALLQERDERIAAFMKQGRSVAVIAELEGLEPDYCRKATRRLAADRGMDYNPDKEPIPRGLLTDASRRFRINMAKLVSDLRESPGRHPLEISRDTGLTQAQQVAASQRSDTGEGYTHDYKLSQLERIAATTDKDFKTMMLWALLTPEEYQKVARCLNS